VLVRSSARRPALVRGLDEIGQVRTLCIVQSERIGDTFEHFR
jgi:hypothetical protein